MTRMFSSAEVSLAPERIVAVVTSNEEPTEVPGSGTLPVCNAGSAKGDITGSASPCRVWLVAASGALAETGVDASVSGGADEPASPLGLVTTSVSSWRSGITAGTGSSTTRSFFCCGCCCCGGCGSCGCGCCGSCCATCAARCGVASAVAGAVAGAGAAVGVGVTVVSSAASTRFSSSSSGSALSSCSDGTGTSAAAAAVRSSSALGVSGTPGFTGASGSRSLSLVTSVSAESVCATCGFFFFLPLKKPCAPVMRAADLRIERKGFDFFWRRSGVTGASEDADDAADSRFASIWASGSVAASLQLESRALNRTAQSG
eukprot:scaffold301_cov243-Pinguiococcus_pyrenoidosus.AAC.57